MWASSWAINGFVGMGKPVAWSVHRIEHELSAFYNITTVSVSRSLPRIGCAMS